MGRGRKESSSDTDSVSSESYARRRKRRSRRSERESSSSESDSDISSERTKKKRKQRRGGSSERERKKEKKRRSRSKKRSSSSRHRPEPEDVAAKDEHGSKKSGSQSKLQVTMEAREQEKFLIYQNAELAKARLSGELKQAQAEQAKMQDMYGAIDWRARKKLRMEKKKLERSVAAGKRLAQMEEEESARMDAFRVALGLPTAEAQRQAEWRAEATRAMLPLDTTPQNDKPRPKKIIGPKLPSELH